MIFKYKVFISFVIVFILVFGSHIVITQPQDFQQFLFPLEAKIAGIKSQCSKNSPKGLNELLVFGQERGSLANQIAYRDSNGGIHHCEGGWADSFFGEPVGETHRYRYASVTKLVTADLILRLIEDKKLSLDTRLLDIFSDIKPTNDARIGNITIAHLLDHSAGFNRLTPEGDIMFFSAKKKWCPFNMQQLAEERLNFAPGEKQIYSNLGYCLLGAVIEKVTGVSYREHAKKIYDLDSLGIKFVDKSFMADEVKYDFRFDPMYDENYQTKYDLNAASAAVGLSGSAMALVKLMEKILSRPGLNLLEPPNFKRCQQNKLEKCYGFAFSYHEKSGSPIVFIHDGYLPGSSALVVVDSRGSILVMLNAGRPEKQIEIEKKAHKLVGRFLAKQHIDVSH